jgi:predicted lipoprotein
MRQVLFISALSALLALTACASDDDDGPASGFSDRQTISDFADDVVVPTYVELASRGDALATAVEALAADPSEANLSAARAAWVATRVPWEQSEAFLFGPVEANGYDPAMDSWPVNQTDLDAVLASGDELSPAYVSGLNETQKGFHTIEYLLYGDGGSKTAAALTPRELDYLVALTTELVGVTHTLADSWTTGDRPYREVFVSAGMPGNTVYPSLSAAAQEIINGMIGICDEVANSKIAAPYDAHDPNLVESQFSFNSLIDFQNNLHSVENAYLGHLAGGTGKGLTVLIAAKDPALDTKVKSELADAIAALGAIDVTFPEAIVMAAYDERIEDAQAKINLLKATLETEVKPLVLE